MHASISRNAQESSSSLPDDGKTKRQDFYRALLTCESTRTEAAFYDIVKAWEACTNAPLVGLWQCNRFSKQFELNGLEIRDVPNPFIEFPTLTEDSVFYLLRVTKKATYVSDVKNWSEFHDGTEYRVVYGATLEKAGLTKALYIPILDGAPECDDSSADLDGVRPLEGIISLFYPASSPEECWPLPAKDAELSEDTCNSLELMGHLTSLLLTKLRLWQQAEIGKQLADLAGKHLARAKDDPREVRREYLSDILDILEEELRIKAASIWWRHPFDETLMCLISKGGLMKSSDGTKLLSKYAIANAEYHPDQWQDDDTSEPWTYKAFRTGDHQLWSPSSSSPHNPVYRDLVDGQAPNPSAFLIMPIPQCASATTVDLADNKALGVMRCAQREGVQYPNIPTHFDIVEVRLLEFIAEQIAPVLHSFESRILREDAIRVIKHDMAASLGTMRDIINEIEGELSSMSDSMRYNLQNMRDCVFSNNSLTDRLARDVEDRIRPRPAKTDLGTQLLPRIKRMLTPYARDESDMEIHFNEFKNIPPLNVDPDLVERALYNLIVNAIKYGRRGSSINITARALPDDNHPDTYAIDVSNKGHGVRDEDIPHVFKIYFRSKYAVGEGSGLGLTIVRQIMRSHDGTAVLEKPRDPTIFRLCFPSTRAAGH